MVNEAFHYKGYNITGCLEHNIVTSTIDSMPVIGISTLKICLLITINTHVYCNSLYYNNTLIIHNDNINENNKLYNEIHNLYKTEQINSLHYFYNIPEEELFYLKLKYNIIPSFFLYTDDIKIEKVQNVNI